MLEAYTRGPDRDLLPFSHKQADLMVEVDILAIADSDSSRNWKDLLAARTQESRLSRGDQTTPAILAVTAMRIDLDLV